MKNKYVFNAYELVNEKPHRIVITVYAKNDEQAFRSAGLKTYAKPVLMSVEEPAPKIWRNTSWVNLYNLSLLFLVGSLVYAMLFVWGK